MARIVPDAANLGRLSGERVTVLYDMDCGVCRWVLSKLLAWDRGGRLRPVAIQSEEGAELLPGMSPEERLASFHAASEGGSARSAGAGLPVVFDVLPGGSILSRLLRLSPAVTSRLYLLVAGNRSTLGKLITGGAARRARERVAQAEAQRTGSPSRA